MTDEINWGPSGELVWVEIPGYGGKYEVSNQGQVRSFAKKGPGDSRSTEPKLLAPNVNPHGYVDYTLFLPGGKRTRKGIGQLVLLSFVGPCPEGHEAAHKNGDKTDNRLENFEWKTHTKNIRDKYEHGTMYYGVRRDGRTWKATV